MNRETRGLIVVTAIACILAVVLLVRAPDEEPRETPVENDEPFLAVPLPSPASVVRDGTEYVVQQLTPLEVEVDLDDHRVMLVHVFDDYSAGSPECNTFDTSARVVQQDSETITLAVFGYALATRADGVACSYVVMSGKQGPERVLRVRLDQPVGYRRIIDARTGEAFGPDQ